MNDALARCDRVLALFSPAYFARRALLEAVTGAVRRLAMCPFREPGDERPSTDGVRVPGSLPRGGNVRRRNPAFTGRERELASLRERLCWGSTPDG
jgi:hypothetical protein